MKIQTIAAAADIPLFEQISVAEEIRTEQVGFCPPYITLQAASSFEPMPSPEPAIPGIIMAACSAAGRRAVNEDCVIAGHLSLYPDAAFSFGAVTGGLGGHAHGDTAASLAVTHFFLAIAQQASRANLDNIPFSAELCLANAFREANDALKSYALSRKGYEEMGCTITGCLVSEGMLHVASVGDSRAYLYREQTLSLLTRDDSFVQDLVDQHRIAKDQARTHPLAYILMRNLGAGQDLCDLAVSTRSLQPGDVVLLCSDGLWKAAEDEIPAILESLPQRSQADMEHAAMALADAALRESSDDNISVVLLTLQGADGTMSPNKET